MDNEKKLVLLYKAKNETDLLIKKSILDSNNIKYILEKYNSQDLFGIEKVGYFYDNSLNSPEIWIEESDFDLATGLITNSDNPVEYENYTNNEETEQSTEIEPVNKNSGTGIFLKIGILILVAIGLFCIDKVAKIIVGFFYK
jgi:hypothetical protein